MILESVTFIKHSTPFKTKVYGTKVYGNKKIIAFSTLKGICSKGAKVGREGLKYVVKAQIK